MSPKVILKIIECCMPWPRIREARVRREAPNRVNSEGPRARRAAPGDFQYSRKGDADFCKIPEEKLEFCIYFYVIPFKNWNIICLPQTACSLVHIIFFLSEQGPFFIKKTYCKLVYFLQENHLYIFIAEKKREGSRIASLIPFTLDKKYFEKHIPVGVCELKLQYFESWKSPIRNF